MPTTGYRTLPLMFRTCLCDRVLASREQRTQLTHFTQTEEERKPWSSAFRAEPGSNESRCSYCVLRERIVVSAYEEVLESIKTSSIQQFAAARYLDSTHKDRKHTRVRFINRRTYMFFFSSFCTNDTIHSYNGIELKPRRRCPANTRHGVRSRPCRCCARAGPIWVRPTWGK
jgi:hypothetical protein